MIWLRNTYIVSSGKSEKVTNKIQGELNVLFLGFAAWVSSTVGLWAKYEFSAFMVHWSHRIVTGLQHSLLLLANTVPFAQKIPYFVQVYGCRWVVSYQFISRQVSNQWTTCFPVGNSLPEEWMYQNNMRNAETNWTVRKLREANACLQSDTTAESLIFGTQVVRVCQGLRDTVGITGYHGRNEDSTSTGRQSQSEKRSDWLPVR